MKSMEKEGQMNIHHEKVAFNIYQKNIYNLLDTTITEQTQLKTLIHFIKK